MITAGGTRIACVLVGLPGRNKTLLAHKVCRYLQWLGVPTRVFNVGNYRRSLYGAAQPHSFFDPANEEGAAQRHHSSQVALDDLVQWLTRHGGTVAIYDATNSTVERRQSIREKCTAKGIEVMFVETICDDESVILENVLQVKLHSPDYEHLRAKYLLADGAEDRAALEKAVVDDFVQRIAHYKDTYVSVNEHGDETDSSFVRLVNLGSSIVIQHITCYLQSRVVFYLMNLHSMPRAIFFTRHGESMANVSGKLGGDTDLSPRGHMYAKTLPRLIKEHMGDRPLTVWTSTLRRTIQTVRYLGYPKLHWKALDELDAGVCDGLTYEEVAELYPQEYAARDEDKFNYRYPGGESYRDVVLRLEPVIMELERQKDILIAGHQAVLRCIYAYFLNYSPDDLPYIKIPLHTVMKLTPTAYGCDIEQYKFDIGAVDTHRPNPKKQASSSTSLSSANGTAAAVTATTSGTSTTASTVVGSPAVVPATGKVVHSHTTRPFTFSSETKLKDESPEPLSVDTSNTPLRRRLNSAYTTYSPRSTTPTSNILLSIAATSSAPADTAVEATTETEQQQQQQQQQDLHQPSPVAPVAPSADAARAAAATSADAMLPDDLDAAENVSVHQILEKTAVNYKEDIGQSLARLRAAGFDTSAHPSHSIEPEDDG